jgi:hypothetical protein
MLLSYINPARAGLDWSEAGFFTPLETTMAKRPDPAPLKRHVDPVTKQKLVQQPSYPAGRGIISPQAKSIDAKIKTGQAARPNPSK